MNKALLCCSTALLALCAFPGGVRASQIGGLRWTQSNIGTLRSFDKTAVVKFLNERTGKLGEVVKPQQVRQYEWVDLAGNGRYELAVVGSSGPCCVVLTIITQNTAGQLTDQNFEGARQLSETIRDLNGDGRMELVIWPELAERGTWAPMAETPRWPAVYRLDNGKYVEASRDFPNFYDTEILPQLDKQIRELQQRGADSRDIRGGVARLLLEKNRILRVLGREPTAGLQDAYQWMNSDDPQLLQCAIATFRDIGGHEKELRAAQQAMPVAIKHEMESRKGG
jgi:hypothetical protein